MHFSTLFIPSELSLNLSFLSKSLGYRSFELKKLNFYVFDSPYIFCYTTTNVRLISGCKMACWVMLSGICRVPSDFASKCVNLLLGLSSFAIRFCSVFFFEVCSDVYLSFVLIIFTQTIRGGSGHTTHIWLSSCWYILCYFLKSIAKIPCVYFYIFCI